MEVYLRLMFLKFHYRLGYESLCREVADSITWRRFCRIGLDGRVPHPTTLMKLTTRCGSAAVDACNEALLAKANEAKLLRTSRLRADTTVVPADVVIRPVVGPTGGVALDLGDGHDVQAGVELAVPGAGESAAHDKTGGHLDRCGAGVGGERRRGAERGDVPDRGEDLCRAR
jgi:hypothetical protein